MPLQYRHASCTDTHAGDIHGSVHLERILPPCLNEYYRHASCTDTHAGDIHGSVHLERIWTMPHVPYALASHPSSVRFRSATVRLSDASSHRADATSQCQMQPATIRCNQPVSDATSHHQMQPATIRCNQPPSDATSHRQMQPATIRCNQPSSDATSHHCWLAVRCNQHLDSSRTTMYIFM